MLSGVSVIRMASTGVPRQTWTISLYIYIYIYFVSLKFSSVHVKMLRSTTTAKVATNAKPAAAHLDYIYICTCMHKCVYATICVCMYECK